MEEVWRASAEGIPDAPGEVGRPEQRGMCGGPPTAPTQQGNVRAGGGAPPSTTEGADLQGFTPERAHLLLREIYEDFTHHNDGTYLSGGFLDDVTWQSCWRRIAVQSDIWYSMPPGKVGCRFTAVLTAEWKGVLDRKWNFERLLVFSHVVLTKTLGARKAREIRARINHQLNLWERGIHKGLVGDALVKGRA